jgi:hypothetical protein
MIASFPFRNCSSFDSTEEVQARGRDLMLPVAETRE